MNPWYFCLFFCVLAPIGFALKVALSVVGAQVLQQTVNYRIFIEDAYYGIVLSVNIILTLFWICTIVLIFYIIYDMYQG